MWSVIFEDNLGNEIVREFNEDDKSKLTLAINGTANALSAKIVFIAEID